MKRISILLVTSIIFLMLRMKIMGANPPKFQPSDNPSAFAKSWPLRVCSFSFLCHQLQIYNTQYLLQDQQTTLQYFKDDTTRRKMKMESRKLHLSTNANKRRIHKGGPSDCSTLDFTDSRNFIRIQSSQLVSWINGVLTQWCLYLFHQGGHYHLKIKVALKPRLKDYRAQMVVKMLGLLRGDLYVECPKISFIAVWIFQPQYLFCYPSKLKNV